REPRGLLVFRHRLCAVPRIHQHVAARQVRRRSVSVASPGERQREEEPLHRGRRIIECPLPRKPFVAPRSQAGGSVSTKVAPSPSRSESDPPCACAMSRLVASPSPFPPGRVVTNRRKIRSRSSGGTPGPSSATTTSA